MHAGAGKEGLDQGAFPDHHGVAVAGEKAEERLMRKSMCLGVDIL